MRARRLTQVEADRIQRLDALRLRDRGLGRPIVVLELGRGLDGLDVESEARVLRKLVSEAVSVIVRHREPNSHGTSTARNCEDYGYD
jgi:hypothetical protein